MTTKLTRLTIVALLSTVAYTGAFAGPGVEAETNYSWVQQLQATGPSGGAMERGAQGPIRSDAVNYCRSDPFFDYATTLGSQFRGACVDGTPPQDAGMRGAEGPIKADLSVSCGSEGFSAYNRTLGTEYANACI